MAAELRLRGAVSLQPLTRFARSGSECIVVDSIQFSEQELPEYPDVELYVTSLRRLLREQILQKVTIKSPFLLRTYEPAIETVQGQKVVEFRRLEKQVVWEMQSGHCLIFHLRIAGRFHWKKQERLPTRKNELAAFQFDHGTMMLTEASKNKRASLHLLACIDDIEAFRKGGLEPLEMSFDDFSERLNRDSRTLKRCLTSQANFSGIGNAYSDEILHTARLSPFKRTRTLKEDERQRLYWAIKSTLLTWRERLIDQTGNRFPEKVTAFRPEMAVHGKFKQPCPVCSLSIQRIRYKDNECNYCPGCQTDGKVLADRSLSRLLKDEWPRQADDL